MKRRSLFTICIVLALAATLIGTQAVFAQTLSDRTSPATSLPLEQLLKGDGTLDLERGFHGSLDTTGWQMVTGPNEEPRFVPATTAGQTTNNIQQLMAVPGDENWDDGFGTPGPNGFVDAIAVSGSEVYGGGYFNQAGGVAANHIAKWDGTSWSALGSGLDGYAVYAIAVNGSEVYVVGDFTTAGGIPAKHIAKWDGTGWSALGSGMNGTVRALAISGSDVYAAGWFTTAGGVAANNIAKWDGTSWSALGSGLSGANYGIVLALAVSGSDVYVGGEFTTAGSVPANYIAKWDGTRWSALGSGMSGGGYGYTTVYALAVSGSDVYVGGNFTTAGGVPANYIAKWDGTSWSALGSGMNGGVYALAVSGNDVYAGGYFTTAGGVPAIGIAKWDGTGWSALGSEMTSSVYAIAVSGSEVYAGGAVTTAGDVPANNIAKWDGTSWSALNVPNQNGLNSQVEALAVSGSDVYAGGWFNTAGGILANRIAKWDGTGWSALGSGWINPILVLAVSGSEVYAAGFFSSSNGDPIEDIAKWDGTSWSMLRALNYSVSAIAVNGSEVYVGGYFTQAGGVPANYIAKWDGTRWSALGSGMNGSVTALAVSGGDLYAGGGFTNAGGVAANHIAKWDGTSWSPLGNGMNEGISALAVSGGEVYAGGGFTSAGGVPANHIAKWDGTSWSALGSGVSGGDYGYTAVSAIAVSGSDVYVGGNFTTAGGVPAKYIVKWNGANWSALGSGMNGVVHALAVSGSKLYAGGYFTTAGGKPSSYFGRYSLNQPPTVAAGGPYSVNEGASVTVIASGSDPEGGPLTYAWDLDNDGTFETPGQSVIFSAAALDGPSTSTISVQVTDEGGLTATAQATVNVLNVAPVATFTTTSAKIVEGQSVTLSFSNPSDPSADDVTAGFRYSFDCTNDGVFELADTSLATYACAYPNPGTFEALGRIADKDGGFTDYTVQVKVLTPREGTQGLIDQVQALIPATLNDGQGNALISKLNAAIQQLDRGKVAAALNQLEAFVNEVNADISSDKLTLEEGQPLLDAANAIIAALGG